MKCKTCPEELTIIKPDCHDMKRCEQCEQEARNYCLRGKNNNSPCVAKTKEVK